MRKVLVILRSRAALPGLLLACFAAGELAIAQLPPAIMLDRYLRQAENELTGGDAAAALAALDRVLDLQSESGLEIPERAWFWHAQAAHGTGNPALALESLVRYFEVSGQGGEDYLAALDLYDVVERVVEALPMAVAAATPEMVVIPAGRFRMGCVTGQNCGDDEFPVHDVTIPEVFAVSKYEVTFSQWDACVLGGGCGGYRPGDEGWGRGNRPAINVSWEDAQAYVSWLSTQTGEEYRLLSEAEWEYVGRAGSPAPYSWGDEIGSNRANCAGCGSQWDDRQTAPVGSFSPNAFGVHDMHGNVWEWVEDCWNESYVGAPSDGSARRSGDCSRRVLRGGSWSLDPRNLRSATRTWGSAGVRYDFSGFRVARTLTP